MNSIEYLEINKYVSATIKKILEEKNISEKEFSEIIGMNYSTFRSKLFRDNFTTAETIKILDLCGYKIIISSK